MKDLYIIGADCIGISEDDKIIVYPSRYIRPLYLIDRKGWVIQEHNEVNAEIEMRDSTLIHTFHTKGAQFLITNDIQSAAIYKPFQPYMKELHARYQSIYFYRIQKHPSKS